MAQQTTTTEVGITMVVDTVEVAMPVAEAQVSVDVVEVVMVAGLIINWKTMAMMMRLLYLFVAEVRFNQLIRLIKSQVLYR